MKILFSVNWNISECPLNAHGMFTEIQISGIVQWPFSEHSVPLNAAAWQVHFSDYSVIFLILREKNSKTFHQIRGFKVVLLCITTHEITKKWGEKHVHGQGRTRVFCSLLFLNQYVTSNPRCFMSSLGWYEYSYVYILSIIDVILLDSFLWMHRGGRNVLKISPLRLAPFSS